jgi:hypothetical protein
MQTDNELILYRNIYNNSSTFGELVYDNVAFCYTLEDKVRAIDEKVFGETAIRAGRYKLSITYSNRFKRMMPYLHDVPMFEGIRIHSGNTAKHSHGCILIGFKHGDTFDTIYESKAAEKSLMDLIFDNEIESILIIDSKAI